MARQIRETFPQGNIQQGRVCSGSSGAAEPLAPGFQCRNMWRSNRQHLLWPLHAAPAQLQGLWGALTLMLPCLWEVSREISGEEGVRNKAEEIFLWSLGLCSAPSLRFELGEALLACAKKFMPKPSVRYPFSSAESPACAHTSSPFSTSLMDQCELCSSGMQSQESWNLDCFSK